MGRARTRRKGADRQPVGSGRGLAYLPTCARAGVEVHGHIDVVDDVADAYVKTRGADKRQPNTGEVEDAVRNLAKTRRPKAIREAERAGYLVRRLEDGSKYVPVAGEKVNKPLFCELSTAGRNLLAPKLKAGQK